MQEDIEQKAISLIIKGGKLTMDTLKRAMDKALAEMERTKREEKALKAQRPKGKQSVKELTGQNQGVSNIEVTDKNIGAFNRVARKYHVDFAVKKDRSTTPPKYLVFFKARDADALTAAFREFTAKQSKKAARPSVLARLQKLISHSKTTHRTKQKQKSKGAER